METIRDPFAAVQAPANPPAFFGNETLESVKLACFTSRPASAPSGFVAPPAARFCAEQNRPILRLAQAEYDLYLNKMMAFQHRIIAQQDRLVDGGSPVLDIDVDTLRSLTGEELKALTPPANAVQVGGVAEAPRVGTIMLHSLKRPEPEYPRELKMRRVQGSVRLAVQVEVDGTTTVLRVLHSPDPGLTRAAEDAVKKWVYAPYLKDGKPTAVSTTVTVHFSLGG
ncbi:energy transducer TonB [Acidipila sp. EB88]|nr:energy transducer TonB [Acidipila sp. EB88]